METPHFIHKGKTIFHNTVKWEVCTNRNTSTRGNSWGWIEHSFPEIYWTNDNKNFDSSDAQEVVRLHNQWIEDQKPTIFRLIENNQQLKSLYTQLESHASAGRIIQGKINDVLAEISMLENQ